MNAVKRCLALIAATLVVGACGGDPTANDAGKDPTIRATPGAVWMRDKTSATVNIEAVDKLGGPVAGSWSVGAITGPVTAVLDTAYQQTSVGALGTKSRFVVTASAEGDATVQFTGTGGDITVPVRVAPDTGDFHVVINDSTPGLFQVLTVTAPTGIVFTGGTTVRMYSGTQAQDTANGGLSFPAVTAISADSTQINLVLGPGASGTMRFGGVASRTTPGLTSSARAPFALTAVPTVDTSAFVFTNTFTNGLVATGNFFDTLLVTAPANYRFLPGTTKIEFFRLTTVGGVANTYTVSNGQSAPKIIGYSADSSQMRVLVAPRARGRMRITPIAFQVAPGRAGFAGINFNVRSAVSDTINTTATDTANMNVTFNKASPVAEGDTVTATAPPGMRFAPTTVSIHAGTSGTFSGGDSARVTGYNADSSQIKFLLPPGASGKAHFRFALLADNEITWNGRSAGTISAAAAPAVVATVTPAAGNMNDTISIALAPAGPYRFRPTSNAIAATIAAPYNFVSADSLTLKVLPTPNTNAPVTLTNIRYSGLPSFLVQANTAGNVQVNAAGNLGPDDIDNSFQFNAPATSGSNAAKGFWDGTTMTDSDPSPACDGGTAAQFYRMHVSVAGSYTITVNWNVAAGGTDIDMGVMRLDGSYDGGGSCSDYLSTSGLSGAKPEVNSALNLTVGDYVIAVIDYNGTTVSSDAISIRVIKN